MPLVVENPFFNSEFHSYAGSESYQLYSRNSDLITAHCSMHLLLPFLQMQQILLEYIWSTNADPNHEFRINPVRIRIKKLQNILIQYLGQYNTETNLVYFETPVLKSITVTNTDSL